MYGNPARHGGMAAALAIAAAGALGGRPILAVRALEGDPRERHRGVSHHSEAVLSLSGDAGWWPRRPTSGVARSLRRAHAEPHGTRGRTKTRHSSQPRTPQASVALAPRLMEERRLGPVVGLGTWKTFDGDRDRACRRRRSAR